MMGGMGRKFDGGYAEYTCVPAGDVIPFRSELEWSTLGAVPEMLQTAYGSLSVGLELQPGQTLLIRGGTSSVGMVAAVLAKSRGATVLSTTRRPTASTRCAPSASTIRSSTRARSRTRCATSSPDGVDAALELVGTNVLPDTLRATRTGGVVCFTGMLSNEWIVPDFYPIGYIPTGVRLTAYGGEASDLPADVLQAFLDDVAAGTLTVPVDRVYEARPGARRARRHGSRQRRGQARRHSRRSLNHGTG